MEHMISMFIDDELGIDEKIEFVEKVHGDQAFKDDTIELLHQEKLIRSEVVARIPEVELKVRKRLTFKSLLRPVGLLVPALAAAVIILLLLMPSQVTTSTPYRFVIYNADASQVEITGSFTEWRKLPMNRKGSSGYWEATIDLPQGEHRFTYILNGNRRVADPTILTREHDDFGGENSILSVGL